MKRQYIIPQTMKYAVETEAPLTQSGGVGSETTGIGYGGTDPEGSHDPAAKYDIWTSEFGAWEDRLWQED